MVRVPISLKVVESFVVRPAYVRVRVPFVPFE